MTGLCAVPGCGRPTYAYGVCAAHRARQRRGSTNTNPIGSVAITTTDGHTYMACPDELVDQAAAIATIDAAAIFPILWKAIGAKRLAFSLPPDPGEHTPKLDPGERHEHAPGFRVVDSP